MSDQQPHPVPTSNQYTDIRFNPSTRLRVTRVNELTLMSVQGDPGGLAQTLDSGPIVVTLALSRVFVPDHQGHPVCSCTFLLLRTALRRRGGVEGGVLVDPPERGRRREVGVAAGDAHRALAAQRATRAEPARTRRPLAQALQVRIQFGEESTACGHRIPHRKWK